MVAYVVSVSKLGDLVGEKLVASLKKQKPNIRIFGVGDAKMQAAGLQQNLDNINIKRSNTLYHTEHLSALLRSVDEIVRDVDRVSPKVLVTIGNWDFASVLHQRVGRKDSIMHVHYVAPEENKHEKVLPIHQLFTIFPNQEKEFSNVSVNYVGNPAVEMHYTNAESSRVFDKYGIGISNRIISVLPGSNDEDIKRNLPYFVKAIELLYKENENFYFAVMADEDNYALVKKITSASMVNINVIEDGADKPFFMVGAAGVIVASKFVSLELMLSGVPHIVAYRQKFLERFTHPAKLKYINMANVAYGKNIVPFLLNKDCNSQNIKDYVFELSEKDSLYKKQMKDFGDAFEFFNNDKQRPSEKAAAIILDMMEHEGCILGADCIYKYE